MGIDPMEGKELARQEREGLKIKMSKVGGFAVRFCADERTGN